MNTSDIESEELLLYDRLEAAETITGTHTFHAYIPLADTRNRLEVKRYFNAETGMAVRIANLQEVLPLTEISGYLICEYDKQWWLALVLCTIDDRKEVEVRFLHPASPSPSFTFLRRDDDLIVAQDHAS